MKTVIPSYDLISGLITIHEYLWQKLDKYTCLLRPLTLTGFINYLDNWLYKSFKKTIGHINIHTEHFDSPSYCLRCSKYLTLVAYSSDSNKMCTGTKIPPPPKKKRKKKRLEKQTYFFQRLHHWFLQLTCSRHQYTKTVGYQAFFDEQINKHVVLTTVFIIPSR